MVREDEPRWHIRVVAGARKDIKQIHKGSAKTDLHTELKDRLGPAPLEFGEPLRGDLYPARRLRIGKFRAGIAAGRAGRHRLSSECAPPLPRFPEKKNLPPEGEARGSLRDTVRAQSSLPARAEAPAGQQRRSGGDCLPRGEEASASGGPLPRERTRSRRFSTKCKPSPRLRGSPADPLRRRGSKEVLQPESFQVPENGMRPLAAGAEPGRIQHGLPAPWIPVAPDVVIPLLAGHLKPTTRQTGLSTTRVVFIRIHPRQPRYRPGSGPRPGLRWGCCRGWRALPRSGC